MNDAARYMKENGFLLAYLQGKSDFYYRYGFYPYRGVSFVRFKRDDARREVTGGRMRTFRKADIPAVATIYNRVTARRTMSAQRDRKLWSWLLRYAAKAWFFPSPKVLEDARGRICGYLTISGEMTVREIVVKPDQASARAALGALVREAKRREAKQIELHLPSDDALAVFLRQYVRSEFLLWTNPTGGQVLAILDFPALMHELEPTLERRWRDRDGRAKQLSFTLASDIGAVGISIRNGRVKVGKPVSRRRVHVPKRWLSGLLTGYYSVNQVANSKGARIPPGLRPTLEILFPPGEAYLYQGDNY